MNDADAKTFVRELKAIGEQVIDVLKRVGETGAVAFPIKDCKVASVDLAAERLPCGHQCLNVTFKLADPVHKEVIAIMGMLEAAGLSPDVEIHEGTLRKDN